MWGNEEGKVMAATLPFRLAGVDTSKDMTPAAVERAVKAGKEAGIPNLTYGKGFVHVISGFNEVMVLAPIRDPERNLCGGNHRDEEVHPRTGAVLH